MDEADRPDRLAATVYIGQFLLTAGWWAWIADSEAARELFFVTGSQFRVFLWADLIAFGGGCLMAGLRCWSGRRPLPFACFVLGAAAYAFLGSLATNWPVGSRPAADIGMLAMLATNVWLVLRLSRR